MGSLMQNKLVAKIQTLNDIHSWDIGGSLLQSVFKVEKLKPQRVATFGEVTAKHGFDVETLGDCQYHWASKTTMRLDGSPREFFQSFHWRRSKVAKSQGMVTFPSTNLKGTRLSGGLFFESQFKKEIDWRSIFSTWCSVLTPYGAILHPAIDLEQPVRNRRDVREYTLDDEISQNAWSLFSTGTFHCEFRAGEVNSLVAGLTNLGWASFLGGEHAHEVDEAAISAAGFPVQRIGDGYLVQVTDDINDVTNDFTLFSKRRAELKSLFRDGLFLIKDEPKISRTHPSNY